MKSPHTATVPTSPRGPEPRRSGRRPRSGAGETHPLLGRFPLAVIALAAVVVIFALMMARLHAGADPDTAPSAPGPTIAAGYPG